MKNAMEKNSIDGLRSSLYIGSFLGESTKTNIDCLGAINGSREKVSKRIEGLLENDTLKDKINTYLSAYAEKIKSDLQR